MKYIITLGIFLILFFNAVSGHAEVIDNSDPGFSSGGSWPSSSYIVGYYGENYQYMAPGNGFNTANWTFDVLAGQYEISAQWTSHSNRASNAGYTVFNNGVEIGTVYVDQRSNGGLFNLLDSYDLEAGVLEVVLTDAADGYVIADAVKITYLGSEINQAPDGVIDAPSGEVTILAGETVVFTGTGTDPDGHSPLTYLWHFGDPAIPDSTSEDPGSVQFNNIGTYTVTFTVTDSQGLADDTPASVMIHVQPESELEIVDNSDPSFSVNGYWPNSNIVPGYYGSDYQYSSPGPGNKEAVWRFSTVTGQYEISAQWTSHSNRASNAAYTVFNNGVEIDTVYVDQRSNGGLFNLLDSYDLEAGTLEVVLTDDADGYVIADAVKITYLGSEINQAPDGVIDAPSGEVTILAGETVVFTGTGTDPDDHTPLTYLWHFGDPAIPDSTSEDPGSVQFNNIGTYTVTFTVTDSQGLADDTPASVMIHVQPESELEIVDNSDPSFSVNGYWPNSNIVPGYYGSDYQYSSPGPGNKEAVWRFSTVTGQYEISAQWTSHSNRASNAGYTVFNNGVEIDTVYVDQLSNGGQFNLLDSYDLEAGTLEVVLTDDADGYVIADAVKITYLDSEINQAPDGVIDAPSGEVTIIAGETVVFTGTGTDPDSNYPLTYLWNFGLGSGVPESSNEDPGEIQFNNEGVFIVTFTVADFIGRVDSTPATLKVNVVAESTYEKDVCVYGGTAGGVIAAIAAADMGSSVILVEPGTHLGGMTSGGLGATDTGKTNSITGLTRDFYERLGARYGKDVSWTHEPHVAEEVLNEMIGEKKVTILFGRRIRSLNKSAGVWIEEVVFENSTNPSQPTVTVSADAFIDCTYEGDLMAKAGVSYIVGRESNVQYGETYNGVRRYWTMPSGVDPYVIPGDPASGLLPFSGVNTSLIGANGSADGLTQAYCFRLCMTTRANRRAISKPAGYDPGDFEFFLRALNRKNPANLSKVFLIRELPNGKWDWNNQEIAGVSLDLVGASHAYPEAGYQTRSQIRQAHLDYTTGLLYFLGHDAQVPQHIRNEMLLWGLCQDEFQDSGGWPHQLYVREARRMIGRYVMTEANCALSVTVDDGIAQGSYAVDSHGVQRYVDDNGWARNEGGFYQYPAGQMAPYDIPYRAITPKANECQNLIVASCISASHVAYSSVRMEPVFMMMGEAAGRAAAMAAEAGIAVQEIDVAQLQTYLATG